MTRQHNRKRSSFRGVASFFVVLSVGIALAQTRIAGKPHSLVGPRGADNAASLSTKQSRATEVVPSVADPQSPLDFLPPVSYSSGGSFVSSIAVADVNGDHKPDLIAASGSVGVLLGNGDGSFQSAGIYDSGGGGSAVAVAIADVNGDGKPDLLVVNEQPSTVGVLFGNGDGTFQTAVTYGSGGGVPLGIAVADVNGDGKPDVVVANGCDPTCNPDNGGVVGVLLGRGDGTFQTAVPYSTGQGFLASVAVADVNGDGIPDLAVADQSGTAGVLLGKGDGTFQPIVSYGSGGQSSEIVIADVNNDGKPDLLVANYGGSGSCADASNDGSLGVLLGNGDGTFQPVVVYDSGGQGASSVAVADVNGDGKPDLLAADFCDINFYGVAGVLLGKGHGTFKKAIGFEIKDGFGEFVVAADMNGDGKPDLLVGIEGVDGEVAVLLNNTDIAPRTTKTVVSTSGSPSVLGQPVTFTARVSSTHGAIPDGESVTFYDKTTELASATLAGGTATYTTSALSAKKHSIKATYPGDPTFKPSTGSVTQVVEKYPTTTTLSSSPNPSQSGQAVTFTVHVTSTGPTPTGNVKFLDGTTKIGSAALSGGVAKLTDSTLAVGTHPITAQYLGDAVSDTSTSSVVNQVVQ